MLPSVAKSQLVKYSEDPTTLLDAFDTAQTATVVYGTLDEVQPGTSVFIYATAPYNPGKNVYFVVEVTGSTDVKVYSYIGTLALLWNCKSFLILVRRDRICHGQSRILQKFLLLLLFQLVRLHQLRLLPL